VLLQIPSEKVSQCISFWIHPLPPSGNDIYHGFKVTITKTGGAITDLGTFDSDPLGSQYVSYVPDTVGEYMAKVEYPGEFFSSTNVTYSASTVTANFTAQTELIATFPEYPIPNDYWTRPISASHRNWGSITGDWLQAVYDSGGVRYGTNTGFNPYTQAPRSAHVLWTQREQLGGLVGGALDVASTYPGTIYDAKMYPPIIMSGVIYYNQFQEMASDPLFVARDLKTGELLWKGNFVLGCGQAYNTLGYNGQGVYYYLWDLATNSSYTMYDPWTGNLRARWYKSAGTVAGQNNYIVMGERGDLYTYYTGGNSTYRWVSMWNSSRAWEAAGILDAGGSSRNTRTGMVYNWNTGIQWNVTIPTEVWKHAGYGNPGLAEYPGDNVWLLTESATTSSYEGGKWLIGMDALTGQILWNSEWTTDSGMTSRDSFGEGYFAYYHPGSMTYSIYNARTGTHVETDPAVAPWGSYAGYGEIAYGTLFAGGYDGYMKAYNLTTGKMLWKTLGDNSGLETPYGHYTMFNGPIIGGGVAFAGYDEHTPNNPLYRGASIYAFDVQTGTKLWTLPAYLGLKALADGCLVGYSTYTAESWVIGKGPSSTTVTAPNVAVTAGTSMVIRGTVTDQSPGQPGTPAISDVDQGAWQAYLHLQDPIPYNATGVPVYLSAVASDGTSIDLGYVISDMSGTFTRTWTPTVAGDYKIYATFQGTDSYGSSYAETTMTVAGASPTPTAAPDIQGPIMTTTIALGIAIIVAIAIVGLLLLRKK